MMKIAFSVLALLAAVPVATETSTAFRCPAVCQCVYYGSGPNDKVCIGEL